MAPCMFRSLDEGDREVPFKEGIGAYRALGVYAINGPSWSEGLDKICSRLSTNACREAQRLAEPGVPISVKSLEY